MTKREALRDLQSRLADRLQAARSDPVSAAWLGVVGGSGHFLLPLSHAGEIFPMATITRVPYSSAWFAGVVNLRGSLFGVVDLAGFLGCSMPRSEQSRSDVRLITLNPELEINCALMVDSLQGLRRSGAFSGFEPAAPDLPVYLGNRYVDAQGVYWRELDVRALSHTTGFLNIGA